MFSQKLKLKNTENKNSGLTRRCVKKVILFDEFMQLIDVSFLIKTANQEYSPAILATSSKDAR